MIVERLKSLSIPSIFLGGGGYSKESAVAISSSIIKLYPKSKIVTSKQSNIGSSKKSQLMLACSEQSSETLRRLLDSGADVNYETTFYDTVLYESKIAEKNIIEAFESLNEKILIRFLEAGGVVGCYECCKPF